MAGDLVLAGDGHDTTFSGGFFLPNLMARANFVGRACGSRSIGYRVIGT
jgi:hypothetical protein